MATTKTKGPKLTAIETQVVRPNRELVVPIQAETDTDFLRYELKGSSNGAQIDEGSGVFRWKPASKYLGGSHKFTVKVTDGDGATKNMTFKVKVMGNLPPTITPIPDQSISVGNPFSYQVQASDPDGDPLTYSLVNGEPELTISAAGLITGTPNMPGMLTVEVEVSDPQGDYARESFDLDVTNQPPTITPIPDQSIAVGSPYSYQVQASDPNGDPLTYDLINGGPELTISGGGLITGTPTMPGTLTVEVEVADPHGATAREQFDLTVTNQPPTITPIPDQNLSMGNPFSYQVQATDPEGEPMTYDLVNGGPELTISAGGLITGTPAMPGTMTVEVEVADPHAATDREMFDLTVTNQPPNITPIPDQSISVNSPFSYQVQATDPDGDPLTYSLINGQPELSISAGGLITGTPSMPGTISVEVEVSDPHGAYVREMFDLIVTNQGPTITPIPDQTIANGSAFSYQVQASDPEAESLNYDLINGGMELSISAGGLITGTPSGPGTISVEVEVTDPHGAYARESFDLTVEP